MSRSSAVLAALLSLASIASCGEEPAGPKPPPVQAIEVRPEEISLRAGTEAQFEADVDRGSARDSSVRWSSTNDSVATVDSTGAVTGVSEGDANVIAAADADPAIKDSAAITVTCVPVGFTVAIHPRDTAIAAGDSLQYRYSTPTDTSSTENEWLSTNTSVATVDSTGLATAVAVGRTSVIRRTELPAEWCGSQFESDTASLEVTD